MGEPQASLKSTVVPLASSTVMVVDDQSTSRAILEQVLRTLDERIMVKSFARPIDAIVWATRHVADLVLVDFAMPEMNGTDFARRLRAMITGGPGPLTPSHLKAAESAVPPDRPAKAADAWREGSAAPLAALGPHRAALLYAHGVAVTGASVSKFGSAKGTTAKMA